jgi:peptidoglycan hydrolase-like protein with peptidoglycan-binding domain
MYAARFDVPRGASRPLIFVPLLSALAVVAVYGVIEGGLALTGRWERDLMQRMEHYRSHQPSVLVVRYEERLRAVRAALRERGYNAGPTDAAMGPRTAEALRSFQKRQGLPVTGRPDPATLTALGLER